MGQRHTAMSIPCPAVSEVIQEFIDVGDNASKHSHVNTNFDSGGASAQRGRGSIGSGIFDEATKTVDSIFARVNGSKASGVSAEGA